MLRKTLALPIALTSLVALALCIACDLSWLSFTLALGLAALALALLRNARVRWVLIALVAPLLARLLFAQGDALRMTTLPGDNGPRWVSKLYPERDGALAAAAFLQWTNRLHDEEGPHFHRIMREAYDRIDADWVPSPAIATYLGLQDPRAFDTVEVPHAQPRGALIFLHGYAGNFHVYCWEVGQAAKSAGLVTFCPSVTAKGDWWSDDGERTFKATLDHVRSLGIQRVYLAGLSNGGAGASVIARRHPRDLAGLVLISGTRGKAVPGLRTLVIQGASDRMMTAAASRSYARGSSSVRYRELAGGHLIMLSRYQTVRSLISDFLRE